MTESGHDRRTTFTRAALKFAGSLAAGLGVAGIFLPLVPTTPFLLLASACFLRSSETLHRRLLDSRWTGPYLRNYQGGRGLPRRAKFATVAVLLATLGLSAWLVPLWWVWAVLLAVAIGVGGYILSLPTAEAESSRESRWAARDPATDGP